MEAPLVTVEVHLANGLPAFHIVGLAEKAVQESRERVRSAILNAGFEFPARRITVNLAPADLPKEGGRFDLPIALGILAASGQVPSDALAGLEFLGELTLSGAVHPVTGILPAVMAASRDEHALFLPAGNLAEASLVADARLHPLEHLLQATAHLSGEQPLANCRAEIGHRPDYGSLPDLAEVRGQAQAKRALTVAAAGGHNLLFSGPPGSGKSMLASRLPSILPPLNDAEALEHAAIASIAGQPFRPERWRLRPYRAPHHTASAVALVGGGGTPRPGEISLAHNGVLFLDELPEFPRHVLEVLREPLESGYISISRASGKAQYPARFQLVAAMNPCPCGHLGDPTASCRCTAEQVARYQARISGPLLDRIDIQVQVPTQPPEVLLERQPPTEPASREIRRLVAAARARQQRRQGCSNAVLNNGELEKWCRLDNASRDFLARAMKSLGLSARAYHRILRVARTIADLAGEERIALPHLSEAVGYRRLV
jgi:magnesium chelatase family protein